MEIPETVHTRAFDSEIVILDLKGAEYYSLDSVGSLAWNGFAAGRCPAEVAKDVAARYDVDFDRALGDVLELANELVVRGLLRIATKGPA